MKNIHPYSFVGLNIPQRDKIKFGNFKKVGISELDKLNVLQSYIGISCEELSGKSRKREFVEARQLIMLILKEYYKFSFETAGNYFSRDHSTAIYGRKTILDLCHTDSMFRRKIETLLISSDLPVELLDVKV